MSFDSSNYVLLSHQLPHLSCAGKRLSFLVPSSRIPDEEELKFQLQVPKDANSREDVMDHLRSLSIPLSSKKHFRELLDNHFAPFSLSPGETKNWAAIRNIRRVGPRTWRWLRDLPIVPWGSTLKSVRGTFGSGVAFYFQCVRLLLGLNLVLSAVSLLFLVAPQMARSSSSADFLPWDPLTATGYLSDSVLFYGHYGANVTAGRWYYVSLAYFSTTAGIYLISLLVIAALLVRTYHGTYLEAETGEFQPVFASKVFAGWDFGRVAGAAAAAKGIAQELGELAYLRSRSQRTGQWGLGTILRGLVWLLLLGLVGASGAGLHFLLRPPGLINKISDPSHRAVTRALIVTAVSFFLPLAVKAVSKLQTYGRKELRLYLYLVSAHVAKTVVLGATLITSLGNLHQIQSEELLRENSSNTSDGHFTQCWETELGQLTYQLQIMDFLFVLAVPTLLKECVRRLVLRRHLQFDVALNTLDLVASQTLLWVGVFFSPVAPVLCAVKMVAVFYAKRASLRLNCCPPVQPWWGTHTQSVFLGALLLNLMAAVTLLNYVANTFHPSAHCGPYQDHYQDTLYQALLEEFSENRLASWLSSIVRFVIKPSFMMVLLASLLLAVFLVRAIAQVNQELNKVLRDQLNLESKDKAFLFHLFEVATDDACPENRRAAEGNVATSSF